MRSEPSNLCRSSEAEEEEMETKNSSITLLHNALIVTMDSETRVFYNGAIVVEKDRIIALGQSDKIFNQFAPLSQNVFDLHGQILLPGNFSVESFRLVS